ncbi:alpha/beta hydrolase fold-3 domain-containing protein [Xylaria intraflava]|nr:alpha/beta hydrolase fold-3 domain-containing protein [Xylaria intraflava]
MAPIWSSQPFTTLFVIFFAIRQIFSLVFNALLFSIAPLRPVREWTFKTSIGVTLLRASLELFTAIRYQRPRQLIPGKSKRRFALIEPPGSDLFSGVLSSKTVQPAPVGAVWQSPPLSKNDPGLKTHKVAIFIPGGGFVLGWEPDVLGRVMGDVYTKHLGAATYMLYVQYRLASPETQFPAAVQDALTAYNYVLDLGVPAENISLVGDSAGGNLVLALLRYLETAQTSLPRPGRALCLSPWVDVTLESGVKHDQASTSRTDLLNGSLLTWGARAYIPDGELSEEVSAFISPLHHPFATKTPVFITAGGVEGFCDSIRQFSGQMSGMEGTRVHFHVMKNMPHNPFAAYPFLGADAEVGVALEEAKKFFEQDPAIGV